MVIGGILLRGYSYLQSDKNIDSQQIQNDQNNNSEKETQE